jgi:HK97 family phage portal protein
MSEERVLSDVVWTPERGGEVPEIRSVAWNNFLLSDEWHFGQGRTAADIRVTPDTALASTAVLACCRILAETVAGLPLRVMRRSNSGGSEVASDIPLYKVLSFAPNEWQTKFEFFEQMMMNLTLWGNSYSAIRSGRYGAVSALDNLHPSRMHVERLENGRLRYSYTNPQTGRLERYTQDQVLHIRWTSEPDGIKGMVPVEVAKEAIALARACEIHASKFWANSARPGMVLQTDSALSAEAAERLRDNWERMHRGSDRSNRTAILTNGLKVEQVGFNAEQSQFETTRKFQLEEISRVYRIPSHLLNGSAAGDLETSGKEFVTYTLMPWLRRIESGISRSLIYNDDLFYAEFDTKGLMRGNSNSRASFYSTMQNLGIYSINDSRRDEGLPPIEHGDTHFVAMNMTPLEQAVKGEQEQDPMAAGAPPEMPGGKPSLAGVKDGEAPPEAPKGEPSEKKPEALGEGDVVTWGDGKIGELKHIMEEGTLDLKSGEAVEVKPGEPVALVVDPASGEEFAVKAAELKKAKPAEAVEERKLSPQNQALYDAQEDIVRKKGRWSQSDAHYQERNPFASRGIHCRNCVYYEEGGTCEIVKGSIRPDAICKLWIIPDERLSIPEQREDCGRQDGGKFGPQNECQKEGSGAAEDSSQHPSSSKSFPEGSGRFRSAIDGVVAKSGGDPAKVWDRSKGLAETPPSAEVGQFADEQQAQTGKPLTPEAEASYQSLVDEIGRQYEALLDSGLKVHAWKGEGEPYGDPPGSTRPNSDKMRRDIAESGEYSFFMTESGFGAGNVTENHPMLRPTKFKTSDGEPMIANDLFRVVHDFVAHVRGGYSFSTNGEFNGTLSHASTLPEAAWPALFAETFGQNAVYERTGGYANQNAYASATGADLIRRELAKRRGESRSQEPDSDEPLGYQHIKSRPYLAKSLAAKAEQRDCGTGAGGFKKGNSCGKGSSDSEENESPSDREFKTTETTKAAIKAIRESGGFSVNPFTADSPTTGYMVSVVPAAETILDSPDAVTDEVMEKFLKDNEQAFEDRPTLHVGGWLDKATGKVYLDLSEQFDDLDDAIDSAEGTNQLAIWDLNVGNEIRKEDYDGRRKRKRKETRSLRSPERPRRKVDRGRNSRTRSPNPRRGEGEERARAAQEGLIAVARRAMGSAMPRVEFRDIGPAVAVYDHASDVLLVSDRACLPPSPSEGYTSQPNPFLHEAAHAIHARANPESYQLSSGRSLTPEQCDLVAREVSEVASLGAREFVAEVLAGTLAGRKYGDDILSLAREVAGSGVIP